MKISELSEQVDYGAVAWDTETSRRHPDDGGTVSVVSIAYRVNGELHAHAFPFDQGYSISKDQYLARYGSVRPSVVARKQSPGQGGLFDELEPPDGPEAPNLPVWDYVALTEWLGRHSLIAHNAKFDVMMTQAGTRWCSGAPIVQALIWDTMLSSKVLEPTHKAGLDECCRRAFGFSGKAKGTAQIKPYLQAGDDKRYDLVPWSIMVDYAQTDAELTYRLWEYQQDLLTESQDKVRMSLEITRKLNVCRVLSLMEMRGIGYDTNTATQALTTAYAVLAEVEQALPFEPTPAAARHWFYETHNATPHCTTEKTQLPGVTECCVRQLIRQGIPGAQEWATRQKVAGAISRWYEGFIARCGTDGRLRTVYKQVKQPMEHSNDEEGARTGRISSTRVNLMALPHAYKLKGVGLERLVPPRSLFKPKPGHGLWEMDLSQAELRHGAKVADCRTMAEAVGTGDAHGATAKLLWPGIDEQSSGWDEKRKLAKSANFGLLYSIGVPRFQAYLDKTADLKLSLDECKALVDNWRDVYHEFPTINRRVERVAEARVKRFGAAWVVLAGGERSYFEPWEPLYKAFNRVVQGSISVAMQHAMVELERDYPGCILLQVHDSLVVELPAETGALTASQMASRMAAIAERLFDCPMVADVKGWEA